MNDLLRVWEFGRDVQPGNAVDVALNKKAAPAAWGRVVKTEGDIVEIQVTQGAVNDPGGLLYLARHGLFCVGGSDRDPGTGRTLLTLRAWPSV